MSESQDPEPGQLILYRTAAGTVRVEVLYQTETFWLSQKQLAELFGVELPTISCHIKEIYDSGELAPAATLRKIRRVQREGNRDVSREIEVYNLDAIISVGYRVNSAQATQFRIWATQTLREFIKAAHVKNQSIGFESPYLHGPETPVYLPDFIMLIDDGRGTEDLLHLVVDVEGYCREDTQKKSRRSSPLTHVREPHTQIRSLDRPQVHGCLADRVQFCRQSEECFEEINKSASKKSSQPERIYQNGAN